MTADVRNRIRSSKGNTEKAISSVKKDAEEVEKYYNKQFDAFEKIQKVRNTAGLIAGMGASLAITGGARCRLCRWYLWSIFFSICRIFENCCQWT